MSKFCTRKSKLYFTYLINHLLHVQLLENDSLSKNFSNLGNENVNSSIKVLMWIFHKLMCIICLAYATGLPHGLNWKNKSWVTFIGKGRTWAVLINNIFLIRTKEVYFALTGYGYIFLLSTKSLSTKPYSGYYYHHIIYQSTLTFQSNLQRNRKKACNIT